MHSTQHFLSNIPKTPTDIDTIKRWELYIAAQVPNIGEISHLASYLDSLALQKINSPRKDTSFRAEYSCFLRMIDLYRDDLPGDARLHNVPQSHLLLSTLSYKLFEHIFEPYLKKHTQEQNFLKVST
jgi:hypothetical protein